MTGEYGRDRFSPAPNALDRENFHAGTRLQGGYAHRWLLLQLGRVRLQQICFTSSDPNPLLPFATARLIATTYRAVDGSFPALLALSGDVDRVRRL